MLYCDEESKGSAVNQQFVTEFRDGNAGPSTPLEDASLRMTASLELSD
jgi:hypothetical protein